MNENEQILAHDKTATWISCSDSMAGSEQRHTLCTEQRYFHGFITLTSGFIHILCIHKDFYGLFYASVWSIWTFSKWALYFMTFIVLCSHYRPLFVDLLPSPLLSPPAGRHAAWPWVCSTPDLLSTPVTHEWRRACDRHGKQQLNETQ